MTVAPTVEEQFRLMLPAGTATCATLLSDPPTALLQVESLSTARMGQKRLREFVAGRSCARLALATLGLQGVGIPVGPDRAPVWPAGVVGSIAHTGHLAVAAVAPSTLVTALGIDAESALALERDLWSRVCRPEELAWTATQSDPALAATLLFSAKESIFKCLWPQTRIFLEFGDLSVMPDTQTGTFSAVAIGSAAPEDLTSRVRGRLSRVADLWLTAAWLP